MIDFDQVSFAYSPGAPIFQGFSWCVQPGELWAVLGPSGGGKSTLLRLLAGLLQPQSGVVRVDGEVLRQPTPRNGLILQDCELLPWSTLRRNAELGLRVQRLQRPWRRWRRPDPALDTAAIAARAEHWLQRLGIAALAERYPHQVSGGERQRCAIARTLVTAARRLLMDEPFAALDVRTREALQELTVQLCQEQGLTGVVVTHALEEAVFMGQRILVLRRGHPVAATIVENPHPCDAGFRDSAACRERCIELREALS